MPDDIWCESFGRFTRNNRSGSAVRARPTASIAVRHPKGPTRLCVRALQGSRTYPVRRQLTASQVTRNRLTQSDVLSDGQFGEDPALLERPESRRRLRLGFQSR